MPKTSNLQPLEAIVNIIEVVETKEISHEYINAKRKDETIGKSKYDELR